jgi:hypothetical protein
MDLGDLAIHPPLRAHLTPVEDEGFSVGVIDQRQGPSFL